MTLDGVVTRVYDVVHPRMCRYPVLPGVAISIIEEQGRKQSPDLTDAAWDHGSTDGDIFTVIMKGVPPTMMAGYDGRVPGADVWHVINYLRALAANPDLDIASTVAEGVAPRRALELSDHARMPITGDLGGELPRGQVARVNVLRDEVDAGLRRLVEETFRARGGRGDALPGAAAVSGRARVDMRFAHDHDGELYVLTKSDGMIRQVVGLR